MSKRFGAAIIAVSGFCLLATSVPAQPTKAVAKCESSTGSTLSKFVGSKGKCFEKCITNEFNGKIPPGSCTQPSPSDAATMACISKTTTKSAATIDKACATAGANPACYTGGFATGSGWVATVEGAVDSALPGTFCGSPSAAFLN